MKQNQAANQRSGQELTFGGEMSWFQDAVTDYSSSIGTLSGRPGSGKSTLAMQLVCAAARAGTKCLVVLTECSKESAQKKLTQLISAYPKRDQQRVLRLVHLVDDLHQMSHLPEFFMRKLSAETHTGHSFGMCVVDSINSGVPGSAMKTYQQVFRAFSILRSAKVPLLAIAQQNKQNRIGGAAGLEFESDINMSITTSWKHRFFSISKNRSGPTLAEPVSLEMTDDARLVLSPFQGSLASSVFSFLPARDQQLVQMQTSISLPPYMGQARLLCGGLPRQLISTLLVSLEQSPTLNVSLGSFITNISMIGDENVFRKSLLLPTAVSIVSSFRHMKVPRNFIWCGECDLDLQTSRSLPESVYLALDAAIESSSLDKGTTVVVPACDSKTLHSRRGIKVVGVNDLYEALSLIEPKARGRKPSNARSTTIIRVSKPKCRKKGGGGSPAPSARSRS